MFTYFLDSTNPKFKEFTRLDIYHKPIIFLETKRQNYVIAWNYRYEIKNLSLWIFLYQLFEHERIFSILVINRYKGHLIMFHDLIFIYFKALVLETSNLQFLFEVGCVSACIFQMLACECFICRYQFLHPKLGYNFLA